MKRLTRREFLRVSALSAGALAISTGLSGCLSGSTSEDRERAIGFNHGVASGDPLQDRVILWTRLTPMDGNTGAMSVGWEVAEDEGFNQLVHSGTTTTTAGNDFTVKVDVLNLSAGTTYYYRFKSNEAGTSPVGQTKTLPKGSVEQAAFAVVSCANYPAGYFNVYAEIAKETDLDAVLHLGDYLYEYGEGQYGTDGAEAIGRALPDDNNTELLTLDEYRARYALYRTDGDCQAVHARWPFIAVWDDHEVANDAWENGAENHQPSSEGDYQERKMQALQAYFEWMPVRPASEDNIETIYRSFEFGNLASLYMLDTRLIARDEQLDYDNYLDGSGGIDKAAFEAAVEDTNREMIGAEQFSWLSNKVQLSTARWQVLGQQVLMGRMLFPAELLVAYKSGDTLAIIEAIQELVDIKQRYDNDPSSVSSDEETRIKDVLPYNLDAWDGYYYEREQVLKIFNEANKNLVVLAGDTHNAWANNLHLDAGNGGTAVGVEFATASVSSPGLETYLQVPPDSIAQVEEALVTLIDDLQYSNASQRGYLKLTLTQDEARSDWRFVDTVKAGSYTIDADSNQALKTTPSNRTIQSVS
ncbi:alkaline phosphatase [Marinobacter halodurans]|uniref:Alkaline phosphatase n=1 Tax=Marinobacter halodurans TaxID=2528979 RepID=A0ABY1ZSA5_9GAMM|nr:alkaline phosphatase D family protein [Marinobacter halodurans]TBW57965.1 alkaline phosphatase [Marinobacter halodurans]